MTLKSTFQLYLAMETTLLNSILQYFCLISKLSDNQDYSKYFLVFFFVNIAPPWLQCKQTQNTSGQFTEEKKKFLAVQNLTKENSCKAAERPRQTDSSFSVCEGYSPLLLCCSISSHPSHSTPE